MQKETLRGVTWTACSRKDFTVPLNKVNQTYVYIWCSLCMRFQAVLTQKIFSAPAERSMPL